MYKQNVYILFMDALNRAISFFGSRAALGTKLGYKSKGMAVRQWESRGSVPADVARRIEELTKGEITRAELCPELFGDINSAA